MIALNKIHYNNPPGIDRPFITLRGLNELTFHQRERLEVAFRLGKLGDTYEFEEYTEIYEDFPIDAEWPDEPMIELTEAEEERLADRLHEGEKDRRWGGQWGLYYGK